MTKKIAILLAVLLLVLAGAAACAEDQTESSALSGRKTESQTAPGDSGQVQATPPSKKEQEQINRELQKMKEEGILDENGQPAPGVDLNKYPGLG